MPSRQPSHDVSCVRRKSSSVNPCAGRPVMFKLAVFTDEVSQDFGRVIRVADEYGLDGLEIRSVWNHGPEQLGESEIALMKKMLADARLEVCCVASPFFKCELDSDDEYRRHLEIL